MTLLVPAFLFSTIPPVLTKPTGAEFTPLRCGLGMGVILACAYIYMIWDVTFTKTTSVTSLDTVCEELCLIWHLVIISQAQYTRIS